MNDKYILALETSCDETSVAIVKNGYQEIASVVMSQISEHELYGGVVPEIASRIHEQNITWALEKVLRSANLKIKDIDAIAVTEGPGLVGALLVGIMVAKTLSWLHNIPLVPVHHIAGHIYASNLEKPMKFPLMALVVSGGHTELILMQEDYSFEKIGGTLDDAVGEAYDKVARLLELGYPGGPYIDKLAKEGVDNYDLPLPLDDNSLDFSFSGLKSAVINLLHNEKQRKKEINKADLAASFQNRVVKILTKKTMRAMEKYQINNLALVGGVAANSTLRETLEKQCQAKGFHFIVPKLIHCTDNATMIGAAGFFAHQLNHRFDDQLKAKSVNELTKE